MVAAAPALPDSLTEVVPPDTIWKAPSMAPAWPLPSVEDDEEAPSVWWLATSAPATRIVPEPIGVVEAEFVPEALMADTAPRQPEPLATIVESSPVWALDTSSSAECAPQLPAELGPKGQVSSNSGVTWSFHRRPPLYPEALLPDLGANSHRPQEPAVSRPSKPKGTSPLQDLESHFSGLNSDRPAYPIDLTDGPQSDESGRSTPTVCSADGAARTGSGKSDERRRRDGEAKSSQASRRSEGLPSWPWDDVGNDLQ